MPFSANLPRFRITCCRLSPQPMCISSGDFSFPPSPPPYLVLQVTPPFPRLLADSLPLNPFLPLKSSARSHPLPPPLPEAGSPMTTRQESPETRMVSAAAPWYLPLRSLNTLIDRTFGFSRSSRCCHLSWYEHSICKPHLPWKKRDSRGQGKCVAFFSRPILLEELPTASERVDSIGTARQDTVLAFSIPVAGHLLYRATPYIHRT